MSLAATYIDADTFTVEGNYTDEFVVNRKVRCNCGADGYKYGVVSSSSFSSPDTTVNLTADSDDLTANLTEVDWSVVKPGTEGNIALHDHEDEDTGGQLDHGLALTGLTDDDHTIYALLAGRAGGQTIYGGNAANDDIIIEPTSHVTKTASYVFLAPSGGRVAIGADAINAKMTAGLTISQGEADDEILALKSSDVAHGMTTITEANTFFYVKKQEAAAGGAAFGGFKDADGTANRAMLLFGCLGRAADTTKATTGFGIIALDSYIKSNSGVTAAGADANLVSIQSAGVTRFIFDLEGEMHSDAVIGEGNDWDEWDDLALASDLSRLPRAQFDEMMKYKAADFERAGLLTLSTDEDGNRHAFIKHKAMLQFAMCCFAEVAQRMRRYEQALLSLGVSPKLLEA